MCKLMSTLYEIVELPNGDIALQSIDEGGDPLVSIRFSKDSPFFIDYAKLDIAKAMIEAGLECVGAVDSITEDDLLEDPDTIIH